MDVEKDQIIPALDSPIQQSFSRTRGMVQLIKASRKTQAIDECEIHREGGPSTPRSLSR
jgi:hypothetical protein